MEASPQNLPILFNEGANGRIGAGSSFTLRCEAERLLHEWIHRNEPRLVEQRLNEFLWLEGKQIIDFLSHANESDGKTQFASYRDHNTAFGCAVELCQNDARNTGTF